MHLERMRGAWVWLVTIAGSPRPSWLPRSEIIVSLGAMPPGVVKRAKHSRHFRNNFTPASLWRTGRHETIRVSSMNNFNFSDPRGRYDLHRRWKKCLIWCYKMRNILAIYRHWAQIDLTKDSMIDVNALFWQAGKSDLFFSYVILQNFSGFFLDFPLKM